MKVRFLSVFAVLLFAIGACADDDVKVGFWFDSPSGIGKASVSGLSLGIPICAMKSIRGAELTLIGGATDHVVGFQYAWLGFTKADTLTGCQLSFVNFVDESEVRTGVQVGFYNQIAKRGIQVGFINNGLNDAKFQFGLVNINHNGLLPVMIFVNFGKNFFK